MTAAYSYKHLSKVQYLRVSSDAMDNSASPGQVIHAINLLLFVCLFKISLLHRSLHLHLLLVLHTSFSLLPLLLFYFV